jgi:hypothetical protein
MTKRTRSKLPKLHLLVAYPYCTASMVRVIKRLQEVADVELMLDSGAFTAWNSGKTIALADYCNFVRTPPLHFHNVVQLDCIGNVEGTRENYLHMRSEGLRCIPVFTRGNTREALDEMYEDSDYVLLGGIATGENVKGYVKWFQTLSGKRKVHWLGFTNREFLAHYRPFSADASSWHLASRMGAADVYVGKGVCRKLTWADCRHPSAALLPLLHSHGFCGDMVKELGTRQRWRGAGSISLDLAASANVLRARDIKARFGTKLYFCVSTPFQVESLTKMIPRIPAQGKP